MTRDELEAAIGRGISDILDAVSSYAAEQIALAVTPGKAAGEPEPPHACEEADACKLDERCPEARQCRQIEADSDHDLCARCGNQFPPGQVCDGCQAREGDRQFLDDAAFDRRLRELMRRDPRLLDDWFAHQARVNSYRSWRGAQ